MVKNSSREAVALTKDSAVVLLEEICSKLECGRLFYLNQSRASDNSTCFHRCLYQDGLLQNCSLSHSNCMLISGVVCGKKRSQNKLTFVSLSVWLCCFIMELNLHSELLTAFSSLCRCVWTNVSIVVLTRCKVD